MEKIHIFYLIYKRKRKLNDNKKEINYHNQ